MIFERVFYLQIMAMSFVASSATFLLSVLRIYNLPVWGSVLLVFSAASTSFILVREMIINRLYFPVIMAIILSILSIAIFLLIVGMYNLPVWAGIGLGVALGVSFCLFVIFWDRITK